MKLAALSLLFITNVKSDVEPLVQTSLGTVKGAILISRLGRQIYSFRGIRYAKAPVNELRFQVSLKEVIFYQL